MAGKLIVEFSLDTKCNLACKYCYSAHTPPNPMSIDTAMKFFERINYMMDYYDKDTYHISYFGGEPLLNWEVIEATLPKFQEDPRCASYVVITNGALLDSKKVQFLKKYNCGISLSFDGLWQNTNRPVVEGTFEGTLEYFKQNKSLIHSITDTCKVMIQPKNFTTMTENFEFFVNDYGFLRPDFCLVRDNIYTKKHVETFAIEVERLARKVLEYQHKGIPASVGLFDLYALDILAGARFGKRDHGCFVGNNGCLYAVDGKFWPCERYRSTNKMVLYSPESGLNLENLKFMSKHADPRKFKKCMNCEIREYCNVGCTHQEMREAKFEGREPIDSVCHLFKHSFKWAMFVFKNSTKEYKDYLYRRLEVGS